MHCLVACSDEKIGIIVRVACIVLQILNVGVVISNNDIDKNKERAKSASKHERTISSKHGLHNNIDQ